MATQVVGFKKIKFHTMENVGAGDLSLPTNEMHTTAYWVTVPAALLQDLPFTPEQKINGLYGLSYIMHGVAPLFLMCDIHDIGVSLGDNSTGESIPPKDLLAKIQPLQGPVYLDADFEPNIFIYDNYPGGIGLSPSLFDLDKTLLATCLKTISDCPCSEGCPSCVGPTKESGEQAKDVALEILTRLLA